MQQFNHTQLSVSYVLSERDRFQQSSGISKKQIYDHEQSLEKWIFLCLSDNNNIEICLFFLEAY